MHNTAETESIHIVQYQSEASVMITMPQLMKVCDAILLNVTCHRRGAGVGAGKTGRSTFESRFVGWTRPAPQYEPATEVGASYSLG